MLRLFTWKGSRTANCLAWSPRLVWSTNSTLCECCWAVSHFSNMHLTSISNISSARRSKMCIAFCMQWIYAWERHSQSAIVTTVLNQSQMDTPLSSPCAKQEAYWAELQRANESLREDLPAGLEPTPLGTERSVVSSMPPNEMHRVIRLTICILLQASRACDGDARPDMKMSCRSIFNSAQKGGVCTGQRPHGGEIFNIWLKTGTSSCARHGVCYVCKVGDGKCCIPLWGRTSSMQLFIIILKIRYLLEPLVVWTLCQADGFKRYTEIKACNASMPHGPARWFGFFPQLLKYVDPIWIRKKTIPFHE